MKAAKGIRARPVMVQGTGSYAGKSALVAAFCRILRSRGLRVAPFKAQNMALNAFVTLDGGEIGRAQAFQAEAAGCEPTVDMNPVLLKPTADCQTQVIVHGSVYATMSATEYQVFKNEAKRFVLESYSRLADAFDVIVIEGAGSPAEINLRENDIANMGMAKMADSPVLVVGDIDRGGVFASLVGTMELLTEAERERVKGFIINKFRGEGSLLVPAIEFVAERTGVPVLGVVPYIEGIILPDEDGVALDGVRSGARPSGGGIRIAVLKLPRISNFTDFDPFRHETGVTVDYISDPGGLDGADMAVIPGSKNTIEDLRWLKQRGFSEALKRFADGGGMVAGICGGLQMMGGVISDPLSTETDEKEAEGLGLIEGSTVLKGEKKTFQVTAELAGMAGIRVSGYEIHMGETEAALTPFATIRRRNGTTVSVEDGFVSEDGNLWGTYIHGIFDDDRFRSSLLDSLSRKKGSAPSKGTRPFALLREEAISSFALTVEKSLDMRRLYDIIGFTNPVIRNAR
jgi:adenosylcobyric acid synthase